MAESTAVIRLNATDDGATSTIQKVGAATEAASNSTNGLKKQLRELQAELASLDPQSAKFQELSARAGQIKDQINDASEAVRANAGSAFEQLGNNASNLASRLASLDFEGAGQSVNALAGNLGKLKFSDLTNGVKAFGGTLANLGKTLLANPLFLIPTLIVGLIAGLYALKDSIPGVAAAFEFVGDAIGAVVDGIKDFTDWIGVTDFAATEQLESQVGQRDSLIGDLDRQEKRAKALARKNGGDIVAIEREYANKRKAIYQGIIDAAQNKINRGGQLNEEELKQLEDAKNAIFDLETDAINKEADAQDKATEEKEKKDEEAQRRAEQRAADAQRKREQAQQKAEQARQQQLQKEQEVENAINKNREERIKANLDAQEKELFELEKTYQAQLKVVGNNEALKAKLIEDYEEQFLFITGKYDEIALKEAEEQAAKEAEIKKQKEAEAQKLKDEALAKEIEKQNLIDQLRLEALQEGLDKELAIRAAKFDADIAAAEGNAEAQKLITEQYIKDVQQIEETAQSESLKKRAENIQKWGKLTANAFGAIAELDKAFRKQDEKNSRAAFNRNKAYSIAQAIVQTGLAVTAALTAGGNPIKLATGAQFVEAGIAAAVGLAQVATIAKTQYNSGGTSGGGGGSSSIPTASAAGGGGGGGVAQFNPLNTNFVNNRPGQVSQTYVLAGDVANAQEARNRVQDLARL